MARRSLERILANVRSSVLCARATRACGERSGLRGVDSELFLRTSEQYRASAEHLMGEAVLMLRRANKKQLTAWLAHRDPHVRQFVLEHIGDR